MLRSGLFTLPGILSGSLIGLFASACFTMGSVVYVFIAVTVVLMGFPSFRRHAGLNLVVSSSFFAGVVFLCKIYPCKPLDYVVPQVHYENVAVSAVCDDLHSKWHFPARIFQNDPAAERIINFDVPKPMSLRRVIEKLCAEQDLSFSEGYCGCGASVLSGASPAFCYLESNRPIEADHQSTGDPEPGEKS